jgi:PPOX class probable F420-dependent enzyme
VAACDIRGRPKGEPVEAVAKVLDKAEAADVQRAITKRYGLFGRLFDLHLKLSGVDNKGVGIELKAAWLTLELDLMSAAEGSIRLNHLAGAARRGLS